MNNQQSLADREQLKSNIADNGKQLETLINRRDRLRRDRMEAKNQYEGYSRDTYSAGAKSRTEAAKQNLDKLSAEHENVNAQISALQQAIDADNTALKAFKIEVGSGEIIELQNAIKADQQRAANLEPLIADQRLIINQADQLVNSVASLKKQRGILLAESAMGVDHGKALAAIDADIAIAEQSDQTENQTKAAAAIKAEETVHGLFDMKRSLDTAILNKKRNLSLMQDTLLGQIAAEEFEVYKVAAQHMADSLRVLAAIDDLIAQIGIRQRSGVLPSTSQQVLLPALADMPKNDADMYLRTVTGVADETGRESLLNRLKAQGIEVA